MLKHLQEIIGDVLQDVAIGKEQNNDTKHLSLNIKRWNYIQKNENKNLSAE